MPGDQIQRALISVHDKTGVVAFARRLSALGVEIISTGGTAQVLRDAQLAVTMVEELTAVPEMMDGRVKTLHPHIHGAILADRSNPEHLRQLQHMGIKTIDLVVVNLYPFAETVADPECSLAQAVEMIDIGGPTLLRAAAKNHRHVVVLPGLDHAAAILDELEECGAVSPATRRRCAAQVFHLLSRYNASIGHYLMAGEEPFPQLFDVPYVSPRALRYGENSTQRAAVFLKAHAGSPESNLLSGQVAPEGSNGHPLIQGAEQISFNNYADAHAALELGKEFGRMAPRRSVSAFVKHGNPCGVGLADDPVAAYRHAYLGDPQAAMGGVLVHNATVDPPLATAVMESLDRWGKPAGAGAFFIEVWIAERFEPAALEVIHSKKKWGARVRLFAVGEMSRPADERELECRSITRGLLVQDRDVTGLNEPQWSVVGRRQPDPQELADLRFAWLVCKHTKSNAISVCRNGMLLGNGAGQMSRVMSCRIATWLARENGHAEQLSGAVAASDAFFPFKDGPEILIHAGITAIIQPGGSKRDADTVAACDEQGVALIMTGTRHFKH